MTMTFGDMPPDDDLVITDDMKNRLAHGHIVFGDSTIMISDTWEIGNFKGHSGFDVHLSVDTVEDAHALFARLSEGGTVGMPMAETFWAAAFGTCHDKFGVPWQVNCDHPS
jgi:PhnB protein